MLTLFRVAAFALVALSLFQVINARIVKRAPLQGVTNAERLAKRLPLARPKRLYDPYRRKFLSSYFSRYLLNSQSDVARADPSGTVTSTTAAFT